MAQLVARMHGVHEAASSSLATPTRPTYIIMNFITFLILIIWLASGYLVVRFVRRTGGTTKIGHVAHWFGGAFVMIGLAIGMTWIFAHLDASFGARANVYVLTHQLRPGDTAPLIQRHESGNIVTVYRRGSVNPAASLVDGQLNIDERQTIRTSLWWMLWDTKYSTDTSSN